MISVMTRDYFLIFCCMFCIFISGFKCIPLPQREPKLAQCFLSSKVYCKITAAPKYVPKYHFPESDRKDLSNRYFNVGGRNKPAQVGPSKSFGKIPPLPRQPAQPSAPVRSPGGWFNRQGAHTEAAAIGGGSNSSTTRLRPLLFRRPRLIDAARRYQNDERKDTKLSKANSETNETNIFAIKHAKIEIRSKTGDALFELRTDADGQFQISTNKTQVCDELRMNQKDANGKMKVVVLYEYTSTYGSFKVDTDPDSDTYFDYLDLSRWSNVGRHIFSGEPMVKSSSPQTSRNVSISEDEPDQEEMKIVLNSNECQTYIHMSNIFEDFHNRTQSKLPYEELSVKLKSKFAMDSAWALQDQIRVSESDAEYIDEELLKHEFGHTLRHTVDGNLWHFFIDVFKYGYVQPHSCDDRTNLGFAFNEGWAEYWAGECKTRKNALRNFYGNTPNDYMREGNVAIALNNIQIYCHGGNPTGHGKLLQVLIENPGKIHSFPQFEIAHKRLFDCP